MFPQRGSSCETSRVDVRHPGDDLRMSHRSSPRADAKDCGGRRWSFDASVAAQKKCSACAVLQESVYTVPPFKRCEDVFHIALFSHRKINKGQMYQWKFGLLFSNGSVSVTGCSIENIKFLGNSLECWNKGLRMQA